MRTKVLPGGVKRVVHVIAKAIRKRMDTGKRVPLIGVRYYSNLNRLYIYRRVDILGPSSLLELDDPLPGTDGRGICTVITDAPLKVYRD